jgi:hypothetical protein
VGNKVAAMTNFLPSIDNLSSTVKNVHNILVVPIFGHRDDEEEEDEVYVPLDEKHKTDSDSDDQGPVLPSGNHLTFGKEAEQAKKLKRFDEAHPGAQRVQGQKHGLKGKGKMQLSTNNGPVKRKPSAILQFINKKDFKQITEYDIVSPIASNPPELIDT